MAKTIDEKIRENEVKINRLKKEQRRLQTEKSKEERKKRTKRLIEFGGAIEAVMKKNNIALTDENRNRVIKYIDNALTKIQQKQSGSDE